MTVARLRRCATVPQHTDTQDDLQTRKIENEQPGSNDCDLCLFNHYVFQHLAFVAEPGGLVEADMVVTMPGDF